MLQRLALIAAAGAAAVTLVAAPAAQAGSASSVKAPPASATVPKAKAPSQFIGYGTYIAWNRSNYTCNNAGTGYIGDITWALKTGLYVSYIRQWHVLQKWNGSSWDTQTWRTWNRSYPSNATYYFAPSQSSYDLWYPVSSYGAGYYRLWDYYQWFWGSNARASRSLYTSYCYLN